MLTVSTCDHELLELIQVSCRFQSVELVTLGGVSRAQLRSEVKARCFAAACLDVSITRLDTSLGNGHKGSALPRPMRDLRRATLASIWNRDGQQGLAAYSNWQKQEFDGPDDGLGRCGVGKQSD